MKNEQHEETKTAEDELAELEKAYDVELGHLKRSGLQCDELVREIADCKATGIDDRLQSFLAGGRLDETATVSRRQSDLEVELKERYLLRDCIQKQRLERADRNLTSVRIKIMETEASELRRELTRMVEETEERGYTTSISGTIDDVREKYKKLQADIAFARRY